MTEKATQFIAIAMVSTLQTAPVTPKTKHSSAEY